VQNLLCVFQQVCMEGWQVNCVHVHCSITECKPWLLTDISFCCSVDKRTCFGDTVWHEVPAATSNLL